VDLLEIRLFQGCAEEPAHGRLRVHSARFRSRWKTVAFCLGESFGARRPYKSREFLDLFPPQK
jgi:hypothetical protein